MLAFVEHISLGAKAETKASPTSAREIHNLESEVTEYILLFLKMEDVVLLHRCWVGFISFFRWGEAFVKDIQFDSSHN